MPIYEIQHSIPLTPSQRDSLAAAITKLHSETFTTPRLFVQAFFTDISQRNMYIGGKRSTGNHIRGQVRSGPSRSQEDWNDLCKQIARAWDDVVRGGGETALKNGNGASGGLTEKETELRSVILMGGMVAGLEVGVILPSAGGDVDWLQGNMEHFEKLAAQGDQEMADLVEEVKERGLLDGSNGYNKVG